MTVPLISIWPATAAGVSSRRVPCNDQQLLSSELHGAGTIIVGYAFLDFRDGLSINVTTGGGCKIIGFIAGIYKSLLKSITTYGVCFGRGIIDGLNFDSVELGESITNRAILIEIR